MSWFQAGIHYRLYYLHTGELISPICVYKITYQWHEHIFKNLDVWMCMHIILFSLMTNNEKIVEEKLMNITWMCGLILEFSCRFGKRYEIPLLIQSIIMNVTMLAMIHLCVHVRSKNQIIRGRERRFTGKIM